MCHRVKSRLLLGIKSARDRFRVAPAPARKGRDFVIQRREKVHGSAQLHAQRVPRPWHEMCGDSLWENEQANVNPV